MSLPKGWQWATVADIADTKLGKMLDAAKNKGKPVRYLGNVNVRWGEFNLSGLQEMRVTQDELDELSVRDGDIFVCEGGEPGRTAVWRDGAQDLIFQKALHRLRVLGDMQANYLAQYLRFAVNQQGFANLLTGTTIRHLPQVALQRMKVAVPPAAQQRRIVAKLDVLTGHLNRARAELDRATVLAERLRAASLASAFCGSHNDSITLSELLEEVQAGKNLKCNERPPAPEEKGIVKVSAVSAEVFRASEAKTLPADYVPPARDLIAKGDLLIARASGSLRLVGKVALVEQNTENLYLSDKVLRLVVKDDLKVWVYWFLRSPLGRRQIENLASGISMHNITQSSLGKIRVPLPNENSRRSALLLITSAFARADRLEAEAARARTLLDRLEAAILTKAFRGELVPQDPNDEPASVLLEWIQSQRALQSKSKQMPKSARRIMA